MKPGTSTKVTIGMLKQSQKRTKRAALRLSVDVEHAGQHHRLVGDDADGCAVHAAEAGEDVLAEVLADLEEVALVGDLLDQLLHVVGRVGVRGDQRVEAGLGAFGIVEGRDGRRLLAVGERQEVDQPADLGQRLDVVLEGAVGDAGFRRMHARAAEFFVR